MLTEEQQAQLDALLEKLEKEGVDYDTARAEYDKLKNSFKNVEVEKTSDSQTKGADVDQEKVVAPESSESPSFLENIKSNLGSTLGKFKYSNPLVSDAVEKERKRKKIKETGREDFYVDKENADIDFSKLDDVNFDTFKNSLVINDKGEYLGIDGKPYKKVLDAYQSAIYAQNGLNFENIEKFYSVYQVKKSNRKDIKKIEIDFLYDFEKNNLNFDNPKVDNEFNLDLEKLTESYNKKKNRYFNKITFKNFINEFFNAYSG